MIIGCVPVFEEANNIGYCVESLFGAGCTRVVVLDGAYLRADGKTFMDGGVRSKDGTVETAELAGADVIVPDKQPRFGEKRQMLLDMCGAKKGDYCLFLDADERAVGMIDQLTWPSGHGCVQLVNRKPNDMPGRRGEWPRGDAGPRVPLLRWLRWSPTLKFEGPGKWTEDGKPVRVYLVESLRDYTDTHPSAKIVEHAHAALQAVEEHLPLRLACALPLIEGFEVHHVSPHTDERVEAKHDFYGGPE